MQRPRRTVEFCEEPGTATKRWSRQRQSRAPSPAPNTAPKYNTRQSRIARPSSTDRQTLLQPNSALRGSRATPQNTPTPSNNKQPATRVLFTAEKQRNAQNDKKWIQEKAQEIVDHLSGAAAACAIEGLSADFFGRAGCLRQISTKQFVAIINYFLHYIWGNRFKVGANYVDDIVNILQKLQYPHQVNKSWLKTPNTPHSFGYVIMLFDFLMDFVPRDEEFPFQEPQTHSQSMTEDQLLLIPDGDFQLQMLRNSEEGFLLWDKQLMQEFGNLQRQTCDLLIQKRCGLQDISALDAEIDQLIQQLDELRAQKPHIQEEDEAHCNRLEQELKRLQLELNTVRAQLEIDSKQLKQLQLERKSGKEEIAHLQQQVANVQQLLQQQMYSVEQRDKLMEEVAQLKHILQSQERTIGELQDRLHQQQVLLSRYKKQLTDKIAEFNGYMREIVYAQLYDNTDELQLPMNPQQNELQTRLDLLKELRKQAEAQLQQYIQQQQKEERAASVIEHEVAINIAPKTIALSARLTVAQGNLQNFMQQVRQERYSMDAKLQALEARAQELQTQIVQWQKSNAQKKEQIKRMREENEIMMSNAEQEYEQCADGREKFLNDYEVALEQANCVMQEFAELIKQRDVMLRQFNDEEIKQ